MSDVFLIIVVLLVLYLIYEKQQTSVDSFTGVRLMDVPPTVIPGYNSPAMRPDTSLAMEIPSPQIPVGTLMVKMYYTQCSKHHPIVELFEHIMKEYEGDPISNTIVFKRELVDPTDPKQKGPFPKIFKYRPNSNGSVDVLEYRGNTNFGQLSDWIRNDGILKIDGKN